MTTRLFQSTNTWRSKSCQQQLDTTVAPCRTSRAVVSYCVFSVPATHLLVARVVCVVVSLGCSDFYGLVGIDHSNFFARSSTNKKSAHIAAFLLCAPLVVPCRRLTPSLCCLSLFSCADATSSHRLSLEYCCANAIDV